MSETDRKTTKIIGIIGSVLFFFSVFVNVAFATTDYPYLDFGSDGQTSLVLPSNGAPQLPTSGNTIIRYSEADGYTGQSNLGLNLFGTFTVYSAGLSDGWYRYRRASFTSSCIMGTETLTQCELSTGNDVALKVYVYNGAFYNDIYPPLPPVVENGTWGSENGFWGDTFTAGDLKNTMVAGVGATGVNIWPLFVLLGIPLAFIIAGYLVYFTQKSVKIPKKTDKKEDFIYHSAEDLEFKREYGQEKPKRKRGRPRKYPI